MVSRLASYLLFVVFVLFATSALKGETPNLDARRAQLNQLLKDEWEYELKESPERATVIGDYRYNDRWSDNSLAHVQQVKHDIQDWLSKFESLQVAGFSEQEKLSQSLTREVGRRAATAISVPAMRRTRSVTPMAPPPT